MKIKKGLTITATVICAATYIFFAVKQDTGPKFAISIDLSKPLAIQWPCEISIVNNNGDKGLRIPPKIGRGWIGEAGGEADYQFFIPRDSKYYIWAYCLWFDKCANAVFAQIDNLDKAILGNNPVYNKWHWVRGFDINLTKGTHRLKLSNHSDHIALQKIVFLNSTAKPQQTGLVFSDIFYDGFDGCDQGNFTRWQQVAGKWTVKSPNSEQCLMNNCLICETANNALITYKNDNWQNYSIDVSVKLVSADSKNSSIGICFGLLGADNFWQLKIRPLRKNNTARISIINSKSAIISEFDNNFEINKWQQIQIALKNGCIEIVIGQNQLTKVPVTSKIKGGIGLTANGDTTVWFDDIHIRKIIHQDNQEQ